MFYVEMMEIQVSINKKNTPLCRLYKNNRFYAKSEEYGIIHISDMKCT